MAVRHGGDHIAVVKYLVEDCHATIHTTDSYGYTPISDAYHQNIANYLKSHVAKVMNTIMSSTLPFTTHLFKIIISYVQ